LVGKVEFFKIRGDLIALFRLLVVLCLSVEPLHDSKWVSVGILWVEEFQESLLFWIEFVSFWVRKILPVSQIRRKFL